MTMRHTPSKPRMCSVGVRVMSCLVRIVVVYRSMVLDRCYDDEWGPQHAARSTQHAARSPVS